MIGTACGRHSAPWPSRAPMWLSVDADGAGVPSEWWEDRVRCVQPGLVPARALYV